MGNRIIGIDFSGAIDAGRKIWLGEGLGEDGWLHITVCRPAASLPNGAPERAQALRALSAYLGQPQGSLVGLDFPFSLPAAILDGQSWLTYLLDFGRRFADAEAFRGACYAAADGAELRRQTDREAKTPFSPYNLRIYRQTFYGLRDLLAPLVREAAVCVLPMQQLVSGRPWLLEVCPASTLKQLRLYRPYKGAGAGYRTARAEILGALASSIPIGFASEALPDLVLDDVEGDALDSVIAAATVFRVAQRPDGLAACRTQSAEPEGHVYV